MKKQMDIREAEQYLTGIQEQMPAAFFRLAEVFKYDAFELCRPKESQDFLIPYMMNDALEYYFLLKEARMTGEFQEGKAVLSARLVCEEERFLLILRQEDGNTATILFRNLEEHAECYRYHEIGHFWRKGQEHWRQLVYMIGTAHDKYEFFGDRFCNEKEKVLISLMHFAPFRYWSPVNESLDAHYPEDTAGLACMEQLAEEAGDQEFLRLLRWYRLCPRGFVRRLVTKQMQSPKRQKLYELIWQKVSEASSEYSVRAYGAVMQDEIREKRAAVERMLRTKGFSGAYPSFYKKYLFGEAQGGSKRVQLITAAEEHPFVISDMDWEEFQFRIRLMVSEISGKAYKEWESCGNAEYVCGKNAGFFRGNGRMSEIVEADEWMKSSENEIEG